MQIVHQAGARFAGLFSATGKGVLTRIALMSAADRY